MKFSKEFMLEDVLYGCNEEVEVIYDNIIDISRWSQIHEIVFKYNGKFYMADYSCGATEYQDESPWEYVEEVTVTEVEPVEVTVTQYKPIK